MPTLENDRLVFRFPGIAPDASFSIDFQRTLRIPDTERDYPLPPGLGRFPVRHAEDFEARLPAATRRRGGVIVPMWQAEALWLNFPGRFRSDLPVAVKVAAGKINAVTGEPWRPGLSREAQDYVVAPEQPWLDGFAVAPGVVRQFVAMPLGKGFSAEEQLTGEAEWGGLQIAVVPMKAEVWRRRRRALEASAFEESSAWYCASAPAEMGLGAGGRMRQQIHADPHGPDAWDLDAADRVFVTVLNARDWKAVTGEAPPDRPPTAQTYADAGLPWFEHYGADADVVEGGAPLAGLKSVGALFEEKTGVALPDSQDVATGVPVALAPGARDAPRPVRVASDAAW